MPLEAHKKVLILLRTIIETTAIDRYRRASAEWKQPPDDG